MWDLCVCVCVCVCVCARACAHMYTYIHVHVCMHAHMCICLYASSFVCVRLRGSIVFIISLIIFVADSPACFETPQSASEGGKATSSRTTTSDKGEDSARKPETETEDPLKAKRDKGML